jgi:hypothetical protein
MHAYKQSMAQAAACRAGQESYRVAGPVLAEPPSGVVDAQPKSVLVHLHPSTFLSQARHTMPDAITFEQLPVQKDGPPFNAWGLYGDKDELGRLNLITPEAIKRGRDEIRHGLVINLK